MAPFSIGKINAMIEIKPSTEILFHGYEKMASMNFEQEIAIIDLHWQFDIIYIVGNRRLF